MRYSLTNYILSLEPNDPQIKSMFGTISIGGEGSYVGSVSFNRQANMFDTQGYATGAWVHNKNLSRVGTATVQLNQLSDAVSKFIKLAETFYSGDFDGFTISLVSITGEKVASGIDSYFTKVPSQDFAESAGNQTWELTCGQVNFGS